jgi:hypothetical protein
MNARTKKLPYPLAPMAEVVAIPEGTGLTTNQLASVLLAIRSFMAKAKKEGWHTEVGAKGWCNDASDQFLHELEDVHGIKGAEIEHYDFDTWQDDITPEMVLKDTARYPYMTDDTVTEWHWAVRIGCLIIDWTARQFDDKAAFPALWVDKNPPQSTLFIDPHRLIDGPHGSIARAAAARREEQRARANGKETP